MVPNGYCPTCVGCQKNCYDVNPRFDAQRRLFMGLLPGLGAVATLTPCAWSHPTGKSEPV
jgi:hypothetical protein